MFGIPVRYPCGARAGAAVVVAFLITLSSTGCDSEFEPFDRSQLLRDSAALAEEQYVALLQATAHLSTTAWAYCADPSIGAEASQEAWRSLSVAWQRQQAVRFGPGKEQQLGAAIAWTPAELGRMRMRELGDPWSTEMLQTSASSTRGISAIEGILFAPEELGLARAADACPYLLANIEWIQGSVQPVRDAWEDGNEHRASFVAFDSEPYPDSQAALNVLVNASIVAIERATVVQLGLPLGDGGEVSPTLVDGYLSEQGLRNTQMLLSGVQDVWAPTDGRLRLFDIVDSRGRGVSGRVSAEFSAAFDALDAIEGPLHEAVTQRPEQVRAAQSAINTLLRSYRTDVSALLAITVGFSDNDGD